MDAPALIVGLGNPGEQYAHTRHNVGAMVVGELARRHGVTLTRQRKTHAHAAAMRLADASAVLAVPLSYMNLSGGPVAALAKYYSVTPDQTVVVHDDLDLPYGTVKLKRGGGSGGHNGLKDVTKALATPEYIRVRVGIGRPPGTMDAAAYVLKPFGSAERADLPMLISDAADAVEMLLTDGLEATQQKFHSS